MIEIKFSNIAKNPEVRAFRTEAIQLSGNSILALFKGSMIPIAQGTGNLWRVGDRLYTSVEITTSRTRKEDAA